MGRVDRQAEFRRTSNEDGFVSQYDLKTRGMLPLGNMQPTTRERPGYSKPNSIANPAAEDGRKLNRRAGRHDDVEDVKVVPLSIDRDIPFSTREPRNYSEPNSIAHPADPRPGHVGFSPDRKYAVRTDADGDFVVSAVEKETARPITIVHQFTLKHLLFSPDSKLLVSDPMGMLNIWDVESGELRLRLQRWNTNSIGPASDIAFSPDSTILAASSGNNTVSLWDLNSAELQRQSFTAHESAVTSLSFSPDGKYLATASDDKSVKIWNLDLLASVVELKVERVPRICSTKVVLK